MVPPFWYIMKRQVKSIGTEYVKEKKRRYKIEILEVTESEWDPKNQSLKSKTYEAYYLHKEVNVLGLFKCWSTVDSKLRRFGELSSEVWFANRDSLNQMIKYLEI